MGLEVDAFRDLDKFGLHLGRRLQYNRRTEKTSRTDQERHPAGKDAVPRG